MYPVPDLIHIRNYGNAGNRTLYLMIIRQTIEVDEDRILVCNNKKNVLVLAQERIFLVKSRVHPPVWLEYDVIVYCTRGLGSILDSAIRFCFFRGARAHLGLRLAAFLTFTFPQTEVNNHPVSLEMTGGQFVQSPSRCWFSRHGKMLL